MATKKKQPRPVIQVGDKLEFFRNGTGKVQKVYPDGLVDVRLDSNHTPKYVDSLVGVRKINGKLTSYGEREAARGMNKWGLQVGGIVEKDKLRHIISYFDKTGNPKDFRGREILSDDDLGKYNAWKSIQEWRGIKVGDKVTYRATTRKVLEIRENGIAVDVGGKLAGVITDYGNISHINGIPKDIFNRDLYTNLLEAGVEEHFGYKLGDILRFDKEKVDEVNDIAQVVGMDHEGYPCVIYTDLKTTYGGQIHPLRANGHVVSVNGVPVVKKKKKPVPKKAEPIKKAQPAILPSIWSSVKVGDQVSLDHGLSSQRVTSITWGVSINSFAREGSITLADGTVIKDFSQITHINGKSIAHYEADTDIDDEDVTPLVGLTWFGFMVGDKVQTPEGVLQITKVGEDYVTAQSPFNSGPQFHFTDPSQLKLADPVYQDCEEKSRFRSEIEAAGYRVAANQAVSLTKNAVVNLLQSRGHSSEQMQSLATLLDTEFGRALISMSFGIGISYVSDEKQKLQKLARECRIQSMSTVGNVIMDTVMSSILDVLRNEKELEEKDSYGELETIFARDQGQSGTVLSTS